MKKDDKSSADHQSLTQKLQKGGLFAARCPSRHVLKHVCSQWGLLALMALRHEPVMRFSELRRKLSGVREKMLTQSLQALVSDGFVTRRAILKYRRTWSTALPEWVWKSWNMLPIWQTGLNVI